MNRKILAVLLFVPVVAFTADKMIGLKSEKSPAEGKISSKAESPNIPEAKLPVKEEKKTMADDNLNSVEYSKINSEELISEMKWSIDHREERQNEYYASEITGVWADKLTKEEKKFIKNKVIRKLESTNVCKIDLKESFSRCPSGYEAYVIVENDKATNTGFLISNSGCDDDPIAKFRFDLTNDKVEARISPKAGYVPLDDFLKIYRSASKRV